RPLLRPLPGPGGRHLPSAFVSAEPEGAAGGDAADAPGGEGRGTWGGAVRGYALPRLALQRGPRPLALGGHTLCYRGSFDRCVASARLGGTNRPRPLAAPVTCSIPAGDRRCRLIVAR
ncbi:unnamed protein product, partial [Coccothraustes coccothraustes]